MKQNEYIFTICFLLLIISFIPYIIYVFGIIFGKKTHPIENIRNLPYISIIISAYNESGVLEERIKNIYTQDYPTEKYEVIFIDDCSEDNTYALAKQEFSKYDIKHTLIRNKTRLGTNASYNSVIPLSKYNIVVTTDADVFFEHSTLTTLISRLISSDNIAAVCADLQPISSETNITKLETTYRGIYGKMCEWESACDSTYNFNGALVAFKKNLVSRIEDGHGSDDANTAFESIRRGFRSVYEPDAIVYERMPDTYSHQFHQKTRRAKRLIEATLYNIDLLKVDRLFRWFYLLRIWMFVISPTLFISGLVLISIEYPIIMAVVLLCCIHPMPRVFIINQIYLVCGLWMLGTNTKTWVNTSSYYKPAFVCDKRCIYRENYDRGYRSLGWCVMHDEPIVSNELKNECVDMIIKS